MWFHIFKIKEQMLEINSIHRPFLWSFFYIDFTKEGFNLLSSLCYNHIDKHLCEVKYGKT